VKSGELFIDKFKQAQGNTKSVSMEGEWEAKPETENLDEPEPEEEEEAEVPHEQELLGKPEDKKKEVEETGKIWVER